MADTGTTDPTAAPDPGPGPAALVGRPALDDPAARPPAPGAAEAAPGARLRRPDDERWATAFGSPSLAPDQFAVATSGRDVYVGGGFTWGFAAMEADLYRRVAWWDGTGWRPMGTGLDGPVLAIVVVGTDVYVGGQFTVAGDVAAAGLARWDGTAWSAVAGGVADPDRPFDTAVRALATDGTTLYVGGSFTSAGDLPVRSLAALDLATATWSDPGGGVALTYSADPGAVHALALDGLRLHVGGAFDLLGDGTATASFATLDTGTGRWTAAGAGITDGGGAGIVHALAVLPDGGVAIGGRFTDAGDVRSWNLAVLRDGAFSSLGDVAYFGGAYAAVGALAMGPDGLHAGGNFTTIGNAEASWWARHDGTAWSVPGDGVEQPVRAMAPTEDGALVVVGDFTISGTLRMEHGGIWTGTGWRTFGQGPTADPYGGGTVAALAPIGHGAYVGGLFDQVGHQPAASIARWDGAGWDTMAGGIRAASAHGQVLAMAWLGDDLYVAGRFDAAGGAPAANIARWDGRAWSTLGVGVDDTAWALAVLGGRLYVGGAFNTAGGVRTSRLACWDPATATWSAVGGAPTYDDDIRALAVIGDRWLVIGGDFHRFFHGGVTIISDLYGMALFDTGREPTDNPLWGYLYIDGTSRYGGTGLVNALQVIGGDLYVGGSFDVAGIQRNGPVTSDGFPAANLAVWHFSEPEGRWETVGGGTDQQVHALAEVAGTLVAGGRFTTAGAAAASSVARFDPTTGTWSALGSGIGGGAGGLRNALALAQSDATGLWVGGQFPAAGGAPSANLALWTATRHGG